MGNNEPCGGWVVMVFLLIGRGRIVGRWIERFVWSWLPAIWMRNLSLEGVVWEVLVVGEA